MNNSFYIELFKRTDSLTEDEMEKLIEPKLFNKILLTDPHPEFRAYVIGHEGVAHGADENNRPVVLKYVKSIIRKLYNVLQTDIPAYFRHNYDADNMVRDEVGTIVGKTMIDNDGKLETIAVIYIKPGYRDKDLDVASLEGFVEIDGDKVVNINKIEAIALSNKNVDEPGFKNAKLVQQLNYFVSEVNHIKPEETDNMNLEDVLKFVKENVVQPNQLFDIETILNDKDVDARIKRELQTKHEHTRRLEEKLKTVETERKAEYDSLNDQMKEYQTKIWGIRGQEYLREKLDVLEDPVELKDIIKAKVISKINPELNKYETEEDIKKHVDEIYTTEYEEIVKLKNILAPKVDDKDKLVEKPGAPLRKYPKPEEHTGKMAIANPKNEIEEKVNELLAV